MSYEWIKGWTLEVKNESRRVIRLKADHRIDVNDLKGKFQVKIQLITIGQGYIF